MPLSQDHLERLRRYDTPTICNLIELFEVRPRTEGYMDARIRACFPELPPMVGFASTAAFRASMPPAGGEAYASIDDQIARFSELDGPAVVVFQDLDDPPVAATFGEVMCTTYRAFGAVGLITSGAGRDLEQVRALDFPVFTSGAICSHGYCHFLNVHLPVHVGGIVVRPNDLLHGDCNGVTTVPQEIVPELLDIADEFVTAEGIILEALREENPSPERIRQARREAREQMERLRRQVSRAPKR